MTSIDPRVKARELAAVAKAQYEKVQASGLGTNPTEDMLFRALSALEALLPGDEDRDDGAATRVAAFCREWRSMRGNDHEQVYNLHGEFPLLMADLEVLSRGRDAEPEQRLITTTAELDALPEGSVVMERDAEPFLGVETIAGVFHKFPLAVQEPGRTPNEGWREWFVVSGHGARPASEIGLPARVLWLPVEEVPEHGE